MERFRHRTVAPFLLIGLLTIRFSAGSQVRTHDVVASVRAFRTSARIDIDGRLIEQAWESAEPFSKFRQRDPDEGGAVTERTQLRVLYDNTSLYIAAELFDSSASGIVSRLSRRDDNPDSDYFALYLDPYHDHQTGRMFEVSASGTQIDSTISNDTVVDNSWDAVWDSAVSRTDTGWLVLLGRKRSRHSSETRRCAFRPDSSECGSHQESLTILAVT